MTTQKYLVSGIVIALVIGVVGVFTGSGAIGPQGQKGEDGQTLGVAAGPDRFNPCESRDGVESCTTRVGFYTASTTVCSLKVNKNSLLQYVTISQLTGTTTALTYTTATSTTGNTASTTALKATAVATSTYMGASKDLLLAGTYVNVSFAGVAAVSLGSGVSGYCQFETTSL